MMPSVKKALIAAALVAAMPLAAAAEDVYAVYDHQCEFGIGGVDNVVIGNKVFYYGDMTYNRISEKTPQANGFYTALYEMSAEGEPEGQAQVSMRITDADVTIVSTTGDQIVAKRCR